MTDKQTTTPPAAPKLTMPTRTLLDGMPYTNAAATDIRELFRRIAEQQKENTT